MQFIVLGGKIPMTGGSLDVTYHIHACITVVYLNAHVPYRYKSYIYILLHITITMYIYHGAPSCDKSQHVR